jgi:hypothetical protein
MALFTPHGLKIRFDEEALEKVIVPLKRSTDFNDLLLDIELESLLVPGLHSILPTLWKRGQAGFRK